METYIELIENQKIQWLFSKLNIKFNTGINGQPLPMLALSYKDRLVTWPMIGQPKLDGVRNIALPGELRSVLMCSRGGKYYIGLSHIETELVEIFAKYPSLMLDGELYTHGVSQNQISGAARKQKRDLFTDYTWLEYHIYDVPSPQGYATNQNAREFNRLNLKNEFSHLKYVKFIESVMVHNEIEAKELHDKYVEQGYEGLILRDMNASYMFSFRDRCLLKYKAFVIEEFKCKGVVLKGSTIDTFNFVLENEDEIEFKCRAKGSHALWERYYANPPIGKMLKVRYINRSAINNVPEKATVLPILEYDKWG